MSDGITNGPEVGLDQALQSVKELEQKVGVSLFKTSDLKTEVFVPQKPNIPINEGLHIQVSSGHDESDLPKQVLGRYLMAEGVAKILAESGLTQDAWANTRIEIGQKVSVYGRVPGEDNSWRKPVDTFNRNVPAIKSLEPFYNTQRLQELSRRYLPKWEELAGKIELFKNGVNGMDVDSSSGEEIPVWQNDKFTLVAISKPHLKDTHLVVHPKESFRRQWQTIRGSDQEQTYIQATLEATAIAMGVQKLLADGKGEIHNSGNWAPDLKTTNEGGKFDLQNFQERIKAEKKSHRPDMATPDKQINTGMHAHVYIPAEGDAVILPPMSKQEAIEKGRTDIVKQWEEIPQITQDQVQEIRVKLGGGKLEEWIDKNCKGQLIVT